MRATRGSLLDDATFARRIDEVLARARGLVRPRPAPRSRLSAPRRKKRTFDQAIREVILEALEDNRRGDRWNISAAALQLDMPRSRLRRFVKRYRFKPGH